jgi:hypothetical protein
MHAQARIPPRDHSRRARVVEVDVRQHEVAEVVERETVARESLLQRIQAARRPAVDQRGLVAGEQVDADDPRPAEVKKIEKLEAAT